MVSLRDDIIDTRDIIQALEDADEIIEWLKEEIEELEEQKQSIEDDIDSEEVSDGEGRPRIEDIESEIEAKNQEIAEQNEEVADLRRFAEENAGDIFDWEDGAQLISEGYFQTFTVSEAEDLHGVRLTEWPMTCIDWAAAAEELKQDYTVIEFDGETYYCRS